jgi:NAD(P)-dependent dehydrogenase (short-subunit alcohol dehydrogenase family)
MAAQNKKDASRFTLGALAAAGMGAVMGLRAMRRERVEFSGRTVVVTGGSRGLGLELARGFVAEGARVVICAREEVELARAEDELRKIPRAEVMSVVCDVTERVQVEAMFERVHARFGAVDVLVNNAGLIQVGPLESMTEEDFDEAMRVHFWAPLYTTQAVLPDMKRRGFGRIVNIASIAGKVSVPHLVPYSASKFALVGLSDGLRAELAQDGILVTTVCPGLMRTGSPPNAFFKGDHEAEYAWFMLGDSMPGLSMNSARAASKILEACRRGDAEALVGLPAKVAALARTLAPNLTASVLAQINRLMPQDGSPERFRGSDSETPLTRSWVTQLTRWAAQRNNELLH